MIVRTEAFVLKAIRFGETSMIYRLFTRDHGIVPVMARGARGPKSRFGSALDSFHRLDVTYHEKGGREIQTLSGVELLSGYPGVVGSLEKMEAAGRWFRLLRGLVPDGAPAEPLFRLMAEGLPRLESTPVPHVRRWEAYHRAAAGITQGVAPRLNACVACDVELPDGGPMAFAVDEGGLLCGGCRQRPGARPLDRGSYVLLTLYHQPEYDLVLEMEHNAGEESSIQHMIHDFIRWHAA